MADPCDHSRPWRLFGPRTSARAAETLRSPWTQFAALGVALLASVNTGCVSRHQSKVLTADDELTCTRIADNEDSSGCWVLSTVGFFLLPPVGIVGWVYCSENDDRAYNQCVKAREMLTKSPQPSSPQPSSPPPPQADDEGRQSDES